MNCYSKISQVNSGLTNQIFIPMSDLKTSANSRTNHGPHDGGIMECYRLFISNSVL